MLFDREPVNWSRARGTRLAKPAAAILRSFDVPSADEIKTRVFSYAQVHGVQLLCRNILHHPRGHEAKWEGASDAAACQSLITRLSHLRLFVLHILQTTSLAKGLEIALGKRSSPCYHGDMLIPA